MTDHTAPERIMVSACGKAIVTGQKPFPGDVEYIRADLHRADVDALVADRDEWKGAISRCVTNGTRPRSRPAITLSSAMSGADARAALRAHTEAAVKRAVKVKPLVWEGDGHWHSGDNEGWMEEASTPFGWGYCVEFGKYGEGTLIVDTTFGARLTGFESPEDAKASAQADYEARILSALDIDPAQFISDD